MSCDEWPYEGARDVCWYCGGRLVWDNDYSLEDVYGEGCGDGIVTLLHCTACGAKVKYTKEEDE